MKKWTAIAFIFVLLMIPYKCNMLFVNNSNNEVVNAEEYLPDIVTVTTYTASEGETDSTPLVTASGFKINPKNPKKHRIIAISRDLRKKYKFGQKVKIQNAGRYNGVYVVRDLMHPRWKKKIDILINPNDKQTKLRKVRMYKVKKKVNRELA